MTATCGPRRITAVIPVYRSAKGAIAAASALARQALPAGVSLEILIVDDGSGDDTPDLIQAGLPPLAQLVSLSANVGRSGARNAGARRATGDLLLFMDCDCLPADGNFIVEQIRAWRDGVVASTGPVLGTGHGFWSRYQAGASARRAMQHAAGAFYSGSGPNLMVSRAAFDACDGFDPGYRAYGFEDRDLLLRLIAAGGDIAWASNAVVRHMDDLDLPTVCRKMALAGGSAAMRFGVSHPDAYRRLGYARLDARLHPRLHLVAKVFRAIGPRLSHLLDPVLNWRGIPYAAKAFAVKALVAMHYTSGTSGPASDD